MIRGFQSVLLSPNSWHVSDLLRALAASAGDGPGGFPVGGRWRVWRARMQPDGRPVDPAEREGAELAVYDDLLPPSSDGAAAGSAGGAPRRLCFVTEMVAPEPGHGSYAREIERASARRRADQSPFPPFLFVPPRRRW